MTTIMKYKSITDINKFMSDMISKYYGCFGGFKEGDLFKFMSDIEEQFEINYDNGYDNGVNDMMQSIENNREDDNE